MSRLSKVQGKGSLFSGLICLGLLMLPPYVQASSCKPTPWDEIGPGLIFGSVPEHKTVKNRLHLDLAPQLDDDQEAMVESLLARGATRADVGQDPDEVSWVVLADPEGIEFCVLSPRDR